VLLAHGVEQHRLAVVYFTVCSTLVFDIVLNDLFVRILSHRVYIISLRPKLSAPQLLFDFGMLFEDALGRDAFDDLGDTGGSEFGNGLNEEMDMVFIRSDFVKADLVPLLDAKAHVLQRLGHFWCEYVSSVLRRADQVVQDERFGMTLQDVFAHQPILARMPPQQSCEAMFLVYQAF